MRPKSVKHLVLHVLGLCCFALPFFNISCAERPGGDKVKVGHVEGYKFIVGGKMTFTDPKLREMDSDKSPSSASGGKDSGKVEPDWRAMAALGGLALGVFALLARLPLGQVLAGLGGIVSAGALLLLAFAHAKTDGDTAVSVAYGLTVCIVLSLLAGLASLYCAVRGKGSDGPDAAG